MKGKRLLMITAAVVLLLGGVIGFAGAQDDTTGLVIAFIGAGTGSQAEHDQNVYQAAVLAAEQVNEDGLADDDGNRYSLSVRYYEADSADDVETARDDAQDAGAVAILMADSSDKLDALLDLGSLNLAVMTAQPDAPNKNNVFRITANQDDWAKALADYLVDQRHFTKIAIAAVDTESAQDGVKTFSRAAGNSNIALTLTHAADDEDFTSDARQIRDADADVVFAWTLDAQMESLLQALHEVGWDGTVVYQGLDADFITRVGAENAAGVIGTFGWTTGAYDSDSQAFAADYAARWDDATPNDRAAAYFDAVNLIADAIRDNGKSRSSILNALKRERDYDGVQGIYDGAETNDLLLAQANSAGELVEVARYTDGDCANCAQIFLPDVTAEDANNREVVTLSLIGTIDGAAESIGQSAANGMELAIREINDNGGVMGPRDTRYTLSLTQYNATNASEMSDAFSSAVSAGSAAVLGPDYNGQILSNLSLAASNDVPQLVTATSSAVTDGNVDDYVFQLRADDVTLANAAAAYLLDERDLTNFATFAVRTDYGIDTVQAVAQTIANSDDGRVVLSLEHNVDETDYTAYAAQIADSNAEAVMVWTSQPAAKALLEALGEAGWNGVFVYGYLTPDMVTNLTVPDGIEVLSPVNWWDTATDWASQSFTERYTERYGVAPTPQSAAYYDAVYLVAKGIETVGSDAEDLQKWIAKQESFRGVQGLYDPKDYGDGAMSRSVTLVQVSVDGVQTLGRYEDGVCWANCG